MTAQAGELIIIKAGEAQDSEHARNVIVTGQGAAMITAEHLRGELHASDGFNHGATILLQNATRILRVFRALAAGEVRLQAETLALTKTTAHTSDLFGTVQRCYGAAVSEERNHVVNVSGTILLLQKYP